MADKEETMPDIYMTITEADRATQEMLADAMVTRAADPDLRAMREEMVAHFAPPPGARLAEIGCGPGDVLRHVAGLAGAAEGLGLDPSPVMIERARDRHADMPALRFMEADGQALPLEDATLDAVLFHTCLCHLPDPDGALAEARRVLKPGGRLAVFDGDYSTTTAALGDGDPVHAAATHAIANLVHDRWLMRSIAPRLEAAGFTVERRDGHAYLPAHPDYFLTLIDRGAQFMQRDGLISEQAAEGLRTAARERMEEGRFFGFIAYLSAIAERRADA
ncbi:MAG: methyltransferase domain-containing protein [Deinococcus-Thermus bacterium]|nr:methyltransferase domain-containing protein [Deinococcota bacterium]